MTKPQRAPLATIFAANIDGARVLPALRGIAILDQPDVIVLEECPRDRSWYRENLPGYRIAEVAPFVKGDRRSVVTLVRKGVKVEHTWLVRIWRRWHGPHGNPHDGRALTPLRLRIRDRRLRTLPAHYPTKRDDNLPAWQEALDKGEDFLERDGDSPLAIIGDVNAGKGVIGPWAKARDYNVGFFGPVDCVIANGADVTVIKKLEPAAGHGWGLVRIDTKENR